jgi:hypothetical protein
VVNRFSNEPYKDPGRHQALVNYSIYSLSVAGGALESNSDKIEQPVNFYQFPMLPYY